MVFVLKSLLEAVKITQKLGSTVQPVIGECVHSSTMEDVGSVSTWSSGSQRKSFRHLEAHSTFADESQRAVGHRDVVDGCITPPFVWLAVFFTEYFMKKFAEWECSLTETAEMEPVITAQTSIRQLKSTLSRPASSWTVHHRRRKHFHNIKHYSTQISCPLVMEPAETQFVWQCRVASCSNGLLRA